MTECPELGALEISPLPPELRDHVSSCNSCKLVLEVFDAAAGRLDVDDCMPFDALLAARADGTLGRAAKNLLERHLASCESCRAVAETLSPTQDADGDHESLPQVDPTSYALGLEVARGGMGRVIAARDLRIGRPIAIKELLGRSTQLAARFEREARVTARLQHPGIVPIYEIGKWPDGTPFYTMRMVDGRMLGDAIESGKSLTARLSLLPAVIAATEAVAFAHSRRVIHRDLTPSNILVGAYGETVVIDWGLAKDLADGANDEEDTNDLAPENSSERLTGVGAVIGTATYMPPEQAHAIPVDERADVYALGAILYHVCAGGPPYRGKTAKELLRAVKTAPPPPIEEVQPGTPRDLVSIITKAMARDPDHRYPSARELAEELKRFQTGRLVEAHAYSRFDLFKRFLRRHRAAVTVTAIALAIGASLGTVAIKKIIDRGRVADETVRELILEKGRIELLAGNTQRALAYLYEAYQRGKRSSDLSFLIGSAVRGLTMSDSTVDCGGSNVRMIAFDHTGMYVAAACHDVARVWKLADHKEVARFDGDDAGFAGIKFSNDGATVATWGESGIARIWNLADGRLRATFDHGSEAKMRDVYDRIEAMFPMGLVFEGPVEINRLTFTPDGARVATTGSDGFAIIWDVATQQPIRRFLAGKGVLRDASSLYGYLSPDGNRLYAMSPDGMGYGWNVETGESLGTRPHGSLALGGDLSADGVYGVSCGQDGRVKVWDLEHGTVVYEFVAHFQPVWKCIFSPDSKLLLSAGQDGRAYVYSLDSGRLVQSVVPGDIVIDSDISRDGRRFVTTGVNGGVKVWDTRSGALVANLDTVRGKHARFAPDNEHLVAGRGDGRIQIWKFEAPNEIAAPANATLGNGGRHIVFSSALSGALETHDLATRRTVTSANGLVAPYAIAEGSPYVAGSPMGQTDTIRILDLTGATPTRDLAIERPIETLQMSADGRRLVLESRDRAPEVWDVASNKQLATLTGATTARLSQTGNRAIAWAESGAIARPVIWDLQTKTAGASLAVDAKFEVIGFARDGTRVAIREDGETTNKVRLFDTTNGAQIAEHSDTSTVATFDPSHSYLTTIDTNHVVTVWSTADGSIARSFVAEQPLSQSSVNPAGTFVAAIAEHGTVALLMSAVDGRILARWQLDHPEPSISESMGLKPLGGTVSWSADGAYVVSRSAAIGVWHVESGDVTEATRDLIKRNLPLRINKDGQLTLTTVRLSGSVTRGGQPVANVVVKANFRAPPDIGVAPVNWTSSKTHMRTKKATTTGLGQFSIKDLEPGEYTISVGETTVTKYMVEDGTISIELP